MTARFAVSLERHRHERAASTAWYCNRQHPAPRNCACSLLRTGSSRSAHLDALLAEGLDVHFVKARAPHGDELDAILSQLFHDLQQTYIPAHCEQRAASSAPLAVLRSLCTGSLDMPACYAVLSSVGQPV